MIPALFDSHCDTLLHLLGSGEHLDSTGGHIDLNRASVYPHYVQFFAAFTHIGEKAMAACPDAEAQNRIIREETILGDRDCFNHFHALVQLFYQEVKRNRERMMDCRCIEDIDQARAEGKVAAVLTVEDAGQIDMSLEEVYAIGVRAIGLTWNYRNVIGGSNLSGGGLTEYGRDFVRKMQKLGILVDLSHSSEELFYDVVKIAEKPFIASHSNARRVCDHPRNLTDEQFLALCRAGGVAGLNLGTGFIHNGGPATIGHCADHIEHFLKLGGARHIAIGGDLDGVGALPEGIEGIQGVWKIADELAARGHSTSLIEDLFYNNLYRVVKEAW